MRYRLINGTLIHAIHRDIDFDVGLIHRSILVTFTWNCLSLVHRISRIHFD